MDLGLRATAEQVGDKPALRCAGRVVTYGELDATVDRVAGGLVRLGLERGDRIGLLLGNTVEFVQALYGALRAGLTVVPLDVAFTPHEVGDVLADCGARGLVTQRADGLGDMRSSLPELAHVIVVDQRGVAGTTAWEELPADGVDTASRTPADPALLQYTAGTTGKPKGAMLSQRNLLANHAQLARTRLATTQDDVVLGVVPLFHIYGLNVALAHTLARGASLVLLDRFDAAATLAAIAAHDVSVVIGTPPMYASWIYTAGLPVEDFAGVRIAVSGGAPLPVEVLERFSATFGVTIWEGYGLSEAAPVLTSNAMSERARPGSVGRPLPDVEIRLVDPHGGPVASGDPGEILARGPNVFSGYWNAPEATAEALDADGWLHTGDIGYAEDGHLYLVDRRHDMIIVSGFNVYPREVEDVLRAHAAVQDAAVVGVPTPRQLRQDARTAASGDRDAPKRFPGETVAATVVPRAGANVSAEELLAHCRRFLARFKCPEAIEFADELPRLSSGKVLRRELRARRSRAPAGPWRSPDGEGGVGTGAGWRG